jgi:hypothetical protein
MGKCRTAASQAAQTNRHSSLGPRNGSSRSGTPTSQVGFHLPVTPPLPIAQFRSSNAMQILEILEQAMGFEPTTPTLARLSIGQAG